MYMKNSLHLLDFIKTSNITNDVYYIEKYNNDDNDNITEATIDSNILRYKTVMNIIKDIKKKYPDKYDKNEIYLRFTNIDKFGINPDRTNRNHNDPVGIYGFPVKWVENNLRLMDYFGVYKYVYVYTVNRNTSNIIILSNLDDFSALILFNRVIKKLIDLYGPNLKVNDFDTFKKQFPTNVHMGNIFDVLTNDVSRQIIPTNLIPQYPAMLTKTFLALGIDGLEDLSEVGEEAIINSNEPSQLLLFNIRMAKVLGKFENIVRPNKSIAILQKPEIQELFKPDTSYDDLVEAYLEIFTRYNLAETTQLIKHLVRKLKSGNYSLYTFIDMLITKALELGPSTFKALFDRSYFALQYTYPRLRNILLNKMIKILLEHKKYNLGLKYYISNSMIYSDEFITALVYNIVLHRDSIDPETIEDLLKTISSSTSNNLVINRIKHAYNPVDPLNI